MADRFDSMTEDELRSECRRMSDEYRRLHGLINHPVTHDFLEGVRIEAPHQVVRWSAEHDLGKGPLDWFWLIGYLSQKVVVALDRRAEVVQHFGPDEGVELQASFTEKALHHTISTAAVLANWHAHIKGEPLGGPGKTFRPGMDMGEIWE